MGALPEPLTLPHRRRLGPSPHRRDPTPERHPSDVQLTRTKRLTSPALGPVRNRTVRPSARERRSEPAPPQATVGERTCRGSARRRHFLRRRRTNVTTFMPRARNRLSQLKRATLQSGRTTRSPRRVGGDCLAKRGGGAALAPVFEDLVRYVGGARGRRGDLGGGSAARRQHLGARHTPLDRVCDIHRLDHPSRAKGESNGITT